MAKKLDLKPILKAVDPEEAIAFFRQKGYRIGFDHQDVWQQEHQAGFTVAKAMQLDLLHDIRIEADKALASGTTLEEFSKQLTPRLQARGWWGKQEMVDPQTGETKLVQLGSPRRLQIIFDTNLATAYSEGQWERIQRNQELFPYLEYLQSASVNPRHTHLGFVGLVLLATDPFWQSHLPIKEYNCKCTVIQHNRRSLEREGLKVGTAPPEVMRTLVNKRTGEVMQVPTGVDPAFHYPPGGRRAHLEKMLADKQAAAGLVPGAKSSPENAPAKDAAAAAAEMARTKDANRMVHSFGPVPVKAAQVIQKLTGLDVSAYQLVFTGEAVKHVLKNHGDPLVEAARKPAQAAVTAEDFALISEIAKQFDDVLPNNVQGKAAPLPSVMLRWALPTHLHQPAVQASVVLEVRTNKKRPRVAVKTLYKRLLKGDPRGE